MKDNKKKNAVAGYFVPFGIKQLSDIIMIIASIVLVVGLCVSGDSFIVALVGTILMTIGAFLILILKVKVLFSGVNKNSAPYKNAVINCVIMGFVFALAVFATIYIALII